eukprot:504169_1
MSLLFYTYILCVHIFTKSNGQAMVEHPRIVGGQPVDVSIYPFMALLINGGKPWCGGSILRKEYPAIILTAAHCFPAFNSNDDIVRLYANDVNDEYNSIDSKIMRYEMHPNFHYSEWVDVPYNDIALIWLSKNISVYDKLQTECCISGDDLQVIGYGTDCFGCNLTLTLEYVDVDYVDRATC